MTEPFQEGEALYRILFDTVSDAILIFDGETKQYLDVNDAATSLYGYSRKEFLKLTIYDITSEREQTDDAILLAFTGKPVRIPLRYHRKKDGATFPVEVTAGSFMLNHRLVLCGVIRDITLRKQTEEELQNYRTQLEHRVEDRTARLRKLNRELQREIAERQKAEKNLKESHQLLEKTFESLIDAVFVVSNETARIIDCNAAALEIFGYTRQEMLGKQVDSLYVSRTSFKKFIKYLFRVVGKNGFLKHYEYRMKRKDGSVFPSRHSITPIDDEGGSRIGWVSIIYDMSEQIQLERARKKAERTLEKQRLRSLHADRLISLGEMAAGMAHELNQPLSGIRGMAEHILISLDRMWNLPQENIKDKLSHIVQQADRMTHIIDHVRLFARKAGKSELTPVDVNKVVQSAIRMTGQQILDYGFGLQSELAEGLPLILANPFSLEEVMLNLVMNARDSLVERLNKEPAAYGSITLKTMVDHRLRKRPVKILIADTGTGISAKVLPKVFDPFFTTKGPDKGTGLGLSICKSIVEDFNGKILIQSHKNQGTSVIISFPEG
ncbi:MAG: PAS domain S-box protein [Desulfobacterales bacterium]|nr:PAS domain S-box protein [Desulfobacterales bacterium]